MRRVAFDIETMADPARLADIPEPEVAVGNLKDPVKIAEKKAEARRQQVERAALDPHFARVVCISLSQRGDDGQIHTDCVFAQDFADRNNMAHAPAGDADEAALLSWFYEELRRPGRSHYVTFNGAGFDVPFLARRALKLGVRPVQIPCGRYQVIGHDAEHLDLCSLLHENEAGTICPRNLRFYVREILGESAPYGDDIDKSEFGRLVEAGQLDVIRQVCTWDTEATLRLCEAVEHVYA